MAIERSVAGWRGAGIEVELAETSPAWTAPERRRRLRRPSVGGAVGLGLVVFLVMTALVGPFVLRVNPEEQQLLDRLAPPVWAGGDAAHVLGTDGLGRDILARIVAGARVSLLIGVVATAVAGVIGVSLGMVAGYAGGVVDRGVTFVTDVQLAVPFVVVAIAVTATLGHGLVNIVLVLALTGWVGYARIVRLQTLALRESLYVEAARVVGVGQGRVLFRHMLPNLTGPIIVIASQQVAAMILYEAALSYLGLGVPGNVITWGGMVADGRDVMMTAWWVSTIPGVAIALAILGLNLMGDWLRDVLDVGGG